MTLRDDDALAWVRERLERHDRSGDRDAVLGPGVSTTQHARAMLAQYPAERPIVLTLSDGKTIEVVPKRKPVGGK